MYSICLTAFFCDYDENDEILPAPIFEDDIVTDERIEYLSILIGLSPKEIKETDIEAAQRIYKRYPFFRFLRLFEEKKNILSTYKINNDTSLIETRLLLAIFGSDNMQRKYNENNILERLKRQLKEYDKHIPGTFHPEGDITQFRHFEETFFDFPQYDAMMKSFFEMYERMSELFFKSWKTELSQDEINEYNLFVSYFRATESATTRSAYYDTLCLHRDLYVSEGYKQLPSYIKINRIATDFEPWKCKQFASSKEYAQKYQDIYLTTKGKIEDFCMHIKYIYCAFKWSDAPYIEDDDDYTPDKYRKYQEWTHIYIPKTVEELGDDAQSALLLKKLASPTSKGGLEAKEPEVHVLGAEATHRIMRYLEWGK